VRGCDELRGGRRGEAALTCSCDELRGGRLIMLR
jgi:hypothetical protein